METSILLKRNLSIEWNRLRDDMTENGLFQKIRSLEKFAILKNEPMDRDGNFVSPRNDSNRFRTGSLYLIRLAEDIRDTSKW